MPLKRKAAIRKKDVEEPSSKKQKTGKSADGDTKTPAKKQAAWQALRDVFPGCIVKGCVFHWSQRIYRKIQAEGLAAAYLQREDKFVYLRKLLCLPYLPSEQIGVAFETLRGQAEEVGGPIARVTDYIQRTWIEGSVWQPIHWSVFRETVRTNNDVEVKGQAGGTFKDMLIDKLWKVLLASQFEEKYFQDLEKKLQAEYADLGKEIFPPKNLIFNAFNLTPLEKVKLVILGQDPYHDNGQAMGLSFSVPKGITVPPSLRNMYKELEGDPKIVGFKTPDHGCLEKWAKDGVLLLNATLTVEAHQPNSHSKYGWQTFTDNVIKAISDHCDHVVFLLYGGFAHKKEKLIDAKKHAIVKTAHPSPLSFNKFKDCNCFSNCNEELKKFGLSPIDWNL